MDGPFRTLGFSMWWMLSIKQHIVDHYHSYWYASSICLRTLEWNDILRFSHNRNHLLTDMNCDTSTKYLGVFQVGHVAAINFIAEFPWLIIAQWRHIATYIWVNIGSGNNLIHYVSQPSPEPILTYHQSCFVAFTWEQFYRKCSWT